MNGTKWCIAMVVCGMAVSLVVHGQSNQQIYQAIQRYNSGTIDGDAFSTTILETVYQSEDPKSIADTLKNSGVAVNDQQQWRDTIIELAEYLGLLGEYQDAVEMYEYLIQHPSSQGASITEMWGRIAVLQFVNNDTQTALASAHKALTTATNQDEVVKALLLDARFRGLSSDPQAGLAAIDALIVHNPSSVHMRLLLYARFEIQQTMGDEAGAEATRTLLLQHYPQSVEYGIVNTQAHNASIIAAPLPVAIDYIYSIYHEHSSDHTHTHRPVVTDGVQSTQSSVVQTPQSSAFATTTAGPATIASTSAVGTTTASTSGTANAAVQQVVVQLGAFTRKSNAEVLQNRGVSIGVPAFVVFVDNIYKVQARVPRTDVSAVQSKLRQANIDAYIVR